MRADTAKLSGTLTFPDLEKLPRHSYVTLLQCGAATPRGIVKWSGVRFSDLANMVGMQRFASYGRLIGSDGYYIDEDMATLMHPQVVLAWLLNDEPIPPQHGSPLRLIIPFRYGARSPQGDHRHPVHRHDLRAGEALADLSGAAGEAPSSDGHRGRPPVKSTRSSRGGSDQDTPCRSWVRGIAAAFAWQESCYDILLRAANRMCRSPVN